MFCENCGNELKPSEKFCGNCGSPIIQTNQSFKENAQQPKWEMKSPFEQAARNKADGSIRKQGKRITVIVAGLAVIMAVFLFIFFIG